MNYNINSNHITIRALLKYAIKLLSHLKTPLLDAEVLLSYVLNKSRVWIKLFDDFILCEKDIYIFKKLLLRRINYEPIAYIVQNKEFWSLSFSISKYVLIPRPDTEILVEHTLNRCTKYSSILDLGTGSGIIALSISYEMPFCKIIGIDYNLQAIYLAQKNARKLNCNNVSFFYSNWFSCINKKFNIIVSNPPYLNYENMFYISKDLLYEPYTALFSSKNGFSDIEYIILNSQKYLFDYGWLLLEHSEYQTVRIVNILKKHNFYNIHSYMNYSNVFRVTVGQKLS